MSNRAMRRKSDQPAAAGEQDFPEVLGWRRMAELDNESREAWELRDGTVLYLDPSGRNDARISRPGHETAPGAWLSIVAER